MNIFILDSDLQKSCQYHTDKHVVKLILEATQIASSAIWLAGGIGPYKLTHKNHPIVKWAMLTRENFHYVAEYGILLSEEYRFRYGKNHVSRSKLHDCLLSYHLFNNLSLTTHPLCMPDEYKILGNPVQSYRNYYNGAKRHLFRWKNRPIPDWITNKEIYG